nr:hypothetical protein GCM10020093_115110 [Planobispora longispora]
MPVEVVGGDVEHRGGVRGDAGRAVQLEAGQLHGQDVVRPGDGLHDRDAHVADRERLAPGRRQHRGEHPHRGGLAVGAGQRQPRRRVPGTQPPGQLDLADHLDPGPGRGDQQRVVRRPAGGDGRRGALGQPGGLAETDLDPQRGELGGDGALPLPVHGLQDHHPLAAPGQQAGGGGAGDPGAQDTEHSDYGSLLGGATRRSRDHLGTHST